MKKYELDKNKAILKIEKKIAEINDLKKLKSGSPQFKKWQRDSEVLIEYVFGQNTRHIKDFREIHYGLLAWTVKTPESDFQMAYIKGLESAEAILRSFIEEIEEYLSDEEISAAEMTRGDKSEPYIDETRIKELNTITTKEFDAKKLIRLLEEINICFQEKCYFGTILLIRALIDHVPPIFGYKAFSEVANNYAGSKSFKESMKRLEESCRKIADQHLHCQIRKSEVLPNKTQIDFKNDVDFLLAEIVRILK